MRLPDRFQLQTASQQIVFGAGSSARLAELAAEHGWHRVMICTTPHLQSNGSVDLLSGVLGDALAAVFLEVEPHVPDYQVEEVIELARRHRVDAVIGLGGGSPIGMAKAVGREIASDRVGSSGDSPGAVQELATIAIPTTYAGSEMTPVYGVTRTQTDGTTRKVTVKHSSVPPRLVLYDPELTLSLPPDLTASTGVNALAHCIEAVYSGTRNPLSTSAALRGIHHISQSLLRCFRAGDEIDARIEMQVGAHLGGVALSTVEMGIHHGTGHVLGGTAGVPHGVANCIVLPHAVRFNAEAVAPHLALVAESMGLERGSRDDVGMAFLLADRLARLIAELHQPQRLREVGIAPDQLHGLAQAMLESSAVSSNPRPLTSAGEALRYLDRMW
jgi:maleylacetate reductase